jgi:molecular chaperone GrpE
MPRHPDPTPADPTPADPTPAEPAAPEELAVEALVAERDAALARAEEHLALAQRAQADYANLRRRTAEERIAMLGLANEILLAKVVGLADDFDLAIAHVPDEARDTAWLEGIAAIDRKLRALLESEGVTPIEALGQPFDPNLHEAIATDKSEEYPDNHVIQVLQDGYTLNGRLLRPAMVRVARG